MRKKKKGEARKKKEIRWQKAGNIKVELKKKHIRPKSKLENLNLKRQKCSHKQMDLQEDNEARKEI